MAFSFTDTKGYAYKHGNIWLGTCAQTGRPVGIQTERHLFCAGSARSGKGAALIIPNLIRWPHSALVVDPKGENAAETWQVRQDRGQTVAALDPFNEADLPDHVRASFNPLAMIAADGDRAREQVQTLADGMVVVHDPKHMEWAEGARDIIAGVIAYVIGEAPPEHRTLMAVRQMLLQGKEDLYADAQRMLDCDACGGLARAAGATILKALESDKGLPHQFLDGARRATKWLDSRHIAACLSRSTFDLADLKRGTLTLFLILPPDEIAAYSAFFRMMVQAALKVMMTGGTKAKGECLFILDEFFSLGRLDLVEEASGRMPGYGVHLWPFVQQIGQLQKLYGKEGSETFLGNADALIFFNPQDSLTLEYISRRAGVFKPRELADMPPDAPAVPHGLNIYSSGIAQADYQSQMNQYSDAMRLAGSPRLTPSEIIQLTGKGNNETVARSMIVFAKAGDVLNLNLVPYFNDQPANKSETSSNNQTASNNLPSTIIRIKDLPLSEIVKQYSRAMMIRVFNPPTKQILMDGLNAFLFWHGVALFGLCVLVAMTSISMLGAASVINPELLKAIFESSPTLFMTALWVSIPAFLIHHFRACRNVHLECLREEAEAEQRAMANAEASIKWNSADWSKCQQKF